MFAIGTVEQSDGTFSDVGMNGRLVVSDLKTENGVRRRCLAFAQRKRIRVAFYHNMHSQNPYKIETYLACNAAEPCAECGA